MTRADAGKMVGIIAVLGVLLACAGMWQDHHQPPTDNSDLVIDPAPYDFDAGASLYFYGFLVPDPPSDMSGRCELVWQCEP